MSDDARSRKVEFLSAMREWPSPGARPAGDEDCLEVHSLRGEPGALGRTATRFGA